MQQADLFDSTKQAKALLDRELKRGAARFEELNTYLGGMTIVDYIAGPTELDFQQDDGINVAVIEEEYKRKWFRINRHALGQLCSKTRLPISYVNYLSTLGATGDELSCYNLKELMRIMQYEKQVKSPLFLVRTVGNTIRGFLSNRYALHLSTDPLLTRFVEYCREQGARPLTAMWSDLRLQAHCALPHIYAPFERLNIVVGMAFFNSDFGAGTFSVYPSVFDLDRGFSLVMPALSLGSTMNSDLFNKIHLGPALHKTDVNKIGSDRARRIDEVSKEMRTNITNRLSREFCEVVCRSIAKARDTTTTWPSIKRELANALLKEELVELERMLKERDAKLPRLELDGEGLPIPTNWWAAQAVSYLASTAIDPDRRIDLEREAGSFLK